MLERVAEHTLKAIHLKRATAHFALSLLITGDDEIQELNREYRQQDKPTDVLSFPLAEEPLVDAPVGELWPLPDYQTLDEDSPQSSQISHPRFITPAALETNLGDIVISWPTVLRQAAQAGHDPIYELLYLFSHGILHLLGYDDQTEEGYSTMVRLQEAVLQGSGPGRWQASPLPSSPGEMNE